MAMDVEHQVGFPYWRPIRRVFQPESAFFTSGNVERELLAKQVALDLTEDEKRQIQNLTDGEERVLCPIAGCGARLNCLPEFEDHYNARHTACSVCSRVYPTSRLLSIHVSEAHDSFFQAKVARGYDMYECLVEGCALKLKSYKNRQQHLVDKHRFPTAFEFFKKSQPSKKQRQKSQSKKASYKKEESSSMMEVENEAMAGLISAVSKLSTSDSTRSSISFGHRHARGITFVPRAVNYGKSQNSKDAANKKSSRSVEDRTTDHP